MKFKYILKIITFIVISVTVAMFTNRIGNGDARAAYAEMENATLPVVYIQYGENLVNRLHGYTNSVEINQFRDAITPMTGEKSIVLWVDAKKEDFDSYNYEVRSLEGSLVEEGTVAEVNEVQGNVSCKTAIRMDLEKNREYMYVLVLTRGDKQIRYYTRIVVEESYGVAELLNYVTAFHQETFKKDEENSFILEKLEPNASEDNSSLAHVTIHSNYDTVTYAGMAPVKISQVIPTIKEICEDYCIFQMEFVMAAGDEEITNYYNVSERYKLKFENDDIILVDYQRDQDELYNYKNVNTTKNWFKIGVAEQEEFSYLATEDQKKVAFIRQGQLWYYDYAKTNIVRVFGFWQEDYLNINNTYNEHDIQLISIDNKGNLAFAVSGYMNRGNHEGATGIAVYRYEAESNRIEELVFVETKLPFEQQKIYTRKLIYINDKDVVFFALRDQIYKISQNGNLSIIANDIDIDNLAVSRDYSRIAYMKDSDLLENQELVLLDLTTEFSASYVATSNERIRPIGFIDGDLVCGKAKQEDVVKQADGTVTFPMYKLEVLNMKQEIQKQYETPDIYLMGVKTVGNEIYFQTYRKNGEEYEEQGQDFITYKEEDGAGKISAIYRYSGTSLNLLYMVFPSNIYVKSVPRLLMTKEFVGENCLHAKADHNILTTNYYVYNTDGLSAIYESATPAFFDAYQNGGLVLNSKGMPIWKDSPIKEYHTVNDAIHIISVAEESQSLAACMQMVLEYNNVFIDMATINAYDNNIEMLFDEHIGKPGLHLANASMDIMLSYLSDGVPLIARLENNHYILITSYNAVSLRYIDPMTGESIKVDRLELIKKLEAAGSEYIVYVP